jgi:5'-nucleotidase
VLQVSGLTYTWDGSRPPGSRVVEARVGGRLLEPAARYRVALPTFLAEGGDGFHALATTAAPATGPGDVETLADHLASLPRPFAPPPGGRIVRRDALPVR